MRIGKSAKAFLRETGEVVSPRREARPRFFPRRPIVGLMMVVGLFLAIWPTRPLRSDNFVFYFPNGHQVLPFEVIEHTKYLPILQVLNLVGKVEGWREKRKSVKVWFGGTQLELHLDEKNVRVSRAWITLSDPIRMSNGQWMVPVDFLVSVLPRITHHVVKYQIGSARVFIGDVKTSTFSVRLDQMPNGARLTFQFTDRVTVRTAAKNGLWVMYLGDRPVEPLEPSYRFQDPYVRELRFDDQDGVPKLILVPTGGGLNFYPVLAEGGKVLLADVIKPPSLQAELPKPQPAPPTPAAPTLPAPAPSAEVPAAPAAPLLPVVVLDAGHGGEDTGARSRDGVLEKDLVAQLAGRVRLGLLATKKYRILLTRSGDTNPSFEQRETAANIVRPAAFLSFHAGMLGAGPPRIGVYTYQPPLPSEEESPQKPEGLFVAWTKVQEAFLNRSQQMAQSLYRRFVQIPDIVADPPVQAPIRILRSVDSPAVAIEIGSLSPDVDSGALASPDLQQRISAAIAQALQDLEGRSS